MAKLPLGSALSGIILETRCDSTVEQQNQSIENKYNAEPNNDKQSPGFIPNSNPFFIAT